MALRVISSVLLLGALAGFALIMVSVFLRFEPGTLVGSYPFTGCTISGWGLLLGGGHAGITCDPSIGPQPLALAAAGIIILVLGVNILGLGGRRMISAVACVVAVALLAMCVFGLSAEFDSQLGRLDLYSQISSQSGPDIGFWVVAGLLLTVSLINSPPGRWAARDGRNILRVFGWRGP
jgi:hypothetical protein